MFHIGIVESNDDPLKLGRLKIRIFGLHSENKKTFDNFQKIKTEDLPWAYPANPITNTSIDGISDFSTLIPGTRVVIFFLDRFNQIPFYFAVLNSIVENMPDFELGFADPTKEHPKEEFLKESTISRLARNEKIDETIVKTKNDNLSEFDHDGTTINEPESSYNAEYPNNRVIETKSGIIIELDDTKNNERIHIYHPSNTYIEVDKDGNKVSKVKKDFEIVLEDKDLAISGNLRITTNGDTSIYSKKDVKIKAADNLKIESENIINIESDSNINIKGGGNVSIEGNIIDLN